MSAIQTSELKDKNGKVIRFVDEEARKTAAENGQKVDQLTKKIAGQTSPEAFGAKGDGVTDDSSAITQALVSGQNVVFDGAKTYAVGSVITIPADAYVDFRGATFVPLGNHDVIRVMPGSHIENLIVRSHKLLPKYYSGESAKMVPFHAQNTSEGYSSEVFSSGMYSMISPG